MKLKPVKRHLPPPPPEPPKEKKERKKSQKKSLASDEYQPLFPPYRFLVSDKPSHKDPAVSVKHYLEIKAIRANDDEGLPVCQVSTYQEAEFYTGYLKGKSITLPVTEIASLVEALSDLDNQCEDAGLMKEYECE